MRRLLATLKAKFHYTRADRTRADRHGPTHGLCRRPARTQQSFSETRAAKKSVRVRAGPVGTRRARDVVEFSYYCNNFYFTTTHTRSSAWSSAHPTSTLLLQIHVAWSVCMYVCWT